MRIANHGCGTWLPRKKTLLAAFIGHLVLTWVAGATALAQEDADEATAAPVRGAAVATSDLIPQRNLMQIIKAGGILMIPIIFCSFITLVFVFERAIALRRGRNIPRPFVKRFLHQLNEGQLDKEKALELCQENGSPVAQVFSAAVKKWGRPAVEVEQAVLDAGERASNGLRKYVRVFNAVSTISPLLGLLGTVFGMIKAFNDISTSDAMGKPEMLSRGISEALITTAAGLSIAIPALVCYLFFLSRVDQLIMELDALGQEVVSAISAEALQTAPKTTRSRSRESAA
ncbi:MAG TPA: MotA/TolQ/ExbB proton channel family protein [Pirellulales bacterium]|nr:MotA/TolQ/ExbB proton channel family protein [Pirellulales bacterium]